MGKGPEKIEVLDDVDEEEKLRALVPTPSQEEARIKAASELAEGNSRGTMGFLQNLKTRANRDKYALHRMDQNMSESYRVTDQEGN